MDVIQKRFPILAVKILNNLDDQSLLKYKKSNRDNCEFLNQERFYWMRILTKYRKKYNEYFETCEEYWRKAISKTPTGFVKKLAIAVFIFFKTVSNGFLKIHFCPKEDKFSPLTPILVAAYDGDLNLFQYMDEKTSGANQAKSETSPIHLAAYRGNMTICRLLLDESDNSKQGLTTLHYAALAGHLDVYQLVYDRVVVKNPKIVTTGQTPLHLASAIGHLEITKFIIDREDDKNPAGYNGMTPLHDAAGNGHLEVYKFIFRNVSNKNPRDDDGNTPLHFAASRNHLDICKFILENITVKTPKNDYGDTPLHHAAFLGHLDICKLIFDYVDEKTLMVAMVTHHFTLLLLEGMWMYASFL